MALWVVQLLKSSMAAREAGTLRLCSWPQQAVHWFQSSATKERSLYVFSSSCSVRLSQRPNEQARNLKCPSLLWKAYGWSMLLTWKWKMAWNATHQTLCVEFANEASAQVPLSVFHQIQYDSLTEQPHIASPSDRLTPSIFLSKRPCERWAVMFLGLDRFHRINNVLGYPTSKDVEEPSVNPKRDGEPHEH